jgi:deoxyribodipyrimidine photolyase-related protein
MSGDVAAPATYDPPKRTGHDACPFTTLNRDFLARHEERLRDNRRLARPLSSMRKLKDLDDVRERAATVVRGIRAGTV